MTGKPRGSDVKERLVEAAVRLLADSGPEALQARKLAAEVGASTMAVYTHFGGMAALLDAVAREGFRRLSANLAAVTPTEDPVADIVAMSLAYRHTAREHPELFAVTFSRSKGRSLAEIVAADDPNEGSAAFGYLLRATERAVEAGRFHGEPFPAAAQLWSGVHGYVTLETSGHFGQRQEDVEDILVPLGVTLAIGLGDTVAAARRSGESGLAGWHRADVSSSIGTDEGNA
jgi:AcrR family transcriptional regulator